MTPASVQIRPAAAKDLPTAGRLGAELVQQHHSIDPQRLKADSERTVDGYARFLATELRRSSTGWASVARWSSIYDLTGI